MAQKTQSISIVVPTLNEAENIQPLVERIDATLTPIKIPYEIVFVDDRSSDNTQAFIKDLAESYPIRLSVKKGTRGKAFSLLQGFKEARYDVVCMIDADLQYPPEAIAPMLMLINQGFADVVVTRRVHAQTSLARQIFSRVFNLIFIQMLFKIHYDTQSGLKVFKKDVLHNMSLRPTPWSFDLEFIIRSLENNRTVMSHDISFESRRAGEAKVNLIKTSFELAKASVSLWRRSSVKSVKNGYDKSLHLERSLVLPLAIVFSFCVFVTQPVNAVAGTLQLRETVKSILNIPQNNASNQSFYNSDASESGSRVAQANNVQNLVNELPGVNLLNPAAPKNPQTPQNSAAQTPTTQTPTTTPQAPQSTSASTAPSTGQSQPTATQPTVATPAAQTPTQVTDGQTGSGQSYAYPATKLSAQTNDFYTSIYKASFIAGLVLIAIPVALYILNSSMRSAKRTARSIKIKKVKNA